MTDEIKVRVYRRLDDRLEDGGIAGLDASPQSWELHRRRGNALHEAFEVDPQALRVTNWGATDDATRTHELVEVTAVILGQAAVAVPATAILGWIGGVLSKALTDTAVDVVKQLIHRLQERQAQRKIADFSLEVSGRLLVGLRPDDGPGTVTVQTADGRWLTASWSTVGAELPPVLPADESSASGGQVVPAAPHLP